MGKFQTSSNKAILQNLKIMSEISTMSNKVALGAGCYWGTELYVKKNFQQMFPNSILKAKVGFMSPNTNAIKNPTYEQVCSGSTGHVEVLNVEINNPEKHFEELIKFFFQFHDPTTRDRQGNDAGTQYASCVFCSDDEQIKIVERVIAELQDHMDTGRVTSYNNKIIVTFVTKMNTFYRALPAHQEYLMNHPNGYCNHRIRFKVWPCVNDDNVSLCMKSKSKFHCYVSSLKTKCMKINFK